MSQLTCNCPHCGQELNVESDFAGQSVACPSCSGEFTIPEAPAANSPVVPQAPALAAAPKLNLPGAAPALQRQPAPAHQQYQAPPQQSPYQSPTSNLGGPQGYGGFAGPNPHSIQLFLQTKPWVTMFAVIGSITPAMLLIAGLLIAFAGVGAGAAAEGMTTGLLTTALGAIYFLPAWRMWQYSSAINKLRIAPNPQTLDNAIDRQRCFWKTVGIITLVGISIGIIMTLIAFSAASGAASNIDSLVE